MLAGPPRDRVGAGRLASTSAGRQRFRSTVPVGPIDVRTTRTELRPIKSAQRRMDQTYRQAFRLRVRLR